ncbi:MAG: 2'-5' RNA ligase family protein [Devosia sp.]
MRQGGHGAPIILTLQLDAAAQDFFERARQAHYPFALNKVGAHVTLFHRLPGEHEEVVVKALAVEAMRAPFPITVDGVRLLGRGVAYTLSSETLLRLRASLAERYRPWLTGQDRERFRPHVTVQNKVSKATARHTYEALLARFAPFSAKAEGVQLWRYCGGPWQAMGVMAFAGPGQ